MNFEIFRWIADRPAVISVVSLIPPAVQDADVQYAVHRRFLPACATRFQGRPGVVQPDVDTLCKEVRRMHFIVFDECNVTRQTVVRCKRIDLMDQVFSMFVRWMCFSGENDLNRPPLIEHHRFDAVQIVEHQRGSLVTGKSACKSDGKGIRIQQRSHGNDLPRIDPVFDHRSRARSRAKVRNFRLRN